MLRACKPVWVCVLNNTYMCMQTCTGIWQVSLTLPPWRETESVCISAVPKHVKAGAEMQSCGLHSTKACITLHALVQRVTLYCPLCMHVSCSCVHVTSCKSSSPLFWGEEIEPFGSFAEWRHPKNN